ncbi:DoxX family protein [Sneathiella chinensis]|uniref:Membrane protein n=1 Tax=Sneathiella chinensis TaxID=349750 RepID=A0ABQ5U4A0_9PROT|nr:DoxX family protein [Sneathiella chinensis]GLQ06553.1 membrane protein [Sneathiella chinensis]
MEKLNPFVSLVARILLSIMFVMAGYGKIGGYEGTQGYMEAMGVPGSLLPLVILLELGGGIALIVGFQTRIVAFLLAGFTFLAALLFHLQPDDQMQMIMFMKNVAVTGGLLLLVAHGAGALSIDGKLKASRS